MFIKTFFKYLADWIFYRRCYFCGKPSSAGIMCEICYENTRAKIKPVSRYKVFNNSEIFSVLPYKDEIQKLIRGIKFHNRTEFAQYAAELLFEYWKNTRYADKNFVIIPMPSHEQRIKQRKYNHMELIALEFSKLCGYPVESELILKIKDTRPQYSLTQKERAENLKDAFKVDKDKYAGENLLLLDDICATGTTMREMIKALNKKGIVKLCGLALSNPDRQATGRVFDKSSCDNDDLRLCKNRS